MAAPMKARSKDFDFDFLDPGFGIFDGGSDWTDLFGDLGDFGFPIPGGEGGGGGDGNYFPAPGGEGGGGGDGTTIGGPPSGGGFSMPSWLTSALGQLGRISGVTGGEGGGPNLAALLPLIAGIGGGVTANNATSNATDAMLASNREATDYLRGRQASFGEGFKPYREAGATSLGQLASMGPSNLASRYKPLGSGRGMR